MNRVLQILLFLFLYILLCSKGCNSNEEADEARNQERIARTRDSIGTAFAADTLSAASLMAFEGMAQQKFSDFSEYLSLLNDTTVAPAFKEKTREMIHELFISENSTLQFSKPVFHSKKEITISQLIEPGSEFSGKIGKIPSDSVRITQSPQRVSDSLYIGRLQFPLVPSFPKNRNPLEMQITKGTISFIITRCKKNFGKDTLRVWNVFLGTGE